MGPFCKFERIKNLSAPVISQHHPQLAGNKYGFEGGVALKEGGLYHLFVAEMAGDPFWIKMRLAHWSSKDSLNWERNSTLFESRGVNSWDDKRSSLWEPTPVFDEKNDCWNLFYVAYRGQGGPNPNEESMHNHGEIWRAVSKTKGRTGIAGPYQDLEVVLRKDAHSTAWEGQQGPDSFFPYQVDGTWYAFYGGHNHNPISPWMVGLVAAPDLGGPWRRLGQKPLDIEKFFVENPVVTKLGHLGFCAVYDSCGDNGKDHQYVEEPCHVGYSCSSNGIDWSRGGRIEVLPPDQTNWSSDVRTPLGLIDEGNDIYTLLFTAKLKEQPFWSIGMTQLRGGH